MEHCSKCSLTLLLAIVATSFYLWHQQAGLNRSKNWISISRPDNFQFDYPHIDEPTERNFCTPLSGRELDLYKKCYAHVYEEKIFKRFGPIVEGDCCFMNGSGRLVVGLGSFPGSGNTWLRGLLEKTTGICTGAPYCDAGLRTKGFSGEGIVGPSVVAIKSHTVRPKFVPIDRLQMPSNGANIFGAALLLIRDPRNALIAEWHRRKTKRLVNATVSSHFLSTSRLYFGTNEDWEKFVYLNLDRWKLHVTGWAINGRNNPMHIIRYEDLQSNATNEVIKIMRFFKSINDPLPFKLAELEAGFDGFHRKHQDAGFNHFTHEQKVTVHQTIGQAISMLNSYYKSNSTIIQCLKSYYYNE